jgi:glycosyltransferase involved in cell wall biosynthesis
MKITLVTDTWSDVNGVVTTLRNTVKQLKAWGHEVQVIEPSLFKTVPFPLYPEVRLSWNVWCVGPMIEQFRPDAIHIATEGPLGLAARWYCKVEKRSIPHNTSYHTKFPEYFHKMFRVPEDWGYYWMRIFHKFSTRVLVTTPSMERELKAKGFERLSVWNRGVDRKIFNPGYRHPIEPFEPVLLCVSRASPEKGLDDFCGLQTRGRKILVGDGPYLETLKKRYPDVEYVGFKHGADLASYYANASVFVFPSKTDTFGVVMIEALACGTPIAGYPVTGPIDVVEQGINGYLDEDLTVAVERALECDRYVVEASSEKYNWSACTETFLNNLVQIEY